MIFVKVNKTKIGMARCLHMTNYRTWFRYTCSLCDDYCASFIADIISQRQMTTTCSVLFPRSQRSS